MPDKVTISHRGARYEIGRGKRYYGIWVAGTPESAPMDRWPETREGWAQAWTRFVSIETPGTINTVEQPRSGFKLPGFRFSGENDPEGKTSGSRSGSLAGVLLGRPRITAAVLLGLGVVLGIVGLFPDYFTGQSLASQADQLVPHLLYLAGWAASAVLVLRGGGKARAGALLGAGLSAVTLGLFLSDLGQVLSGASGLEAGIVISIVGWGLSTAGAAVGLAVRPAAPATSPAPAMASATDITSTDVTSTDITSTDIAGMGAAQTLSLGEPEAATAVTAAPTARRGGPVRPSARHAGPIALLVLGAIGAVAAFTPSWDTYTISSSATGTETITAGNAFTQPGWVVAGDILVIIAVVVAAVLAALWRPMRQGAALLAGAIIPMAAQAISAVIQVGQPTAPSQFGITQGEASEIGLSITNGLTPVFWVYCVFVIALLISCAWLITEPMLPDATASAQPAWLGPIGGPIPPLAGDAEENADDTGDSAGDSDDDISAETRGQTGDENTDNSGGAEDGGTEGNEENTYA